MLNIEDIVNTSKKIESLLESKIFAEGKGLHEKLSSIEGGLPVHIVKSIRWIATIRNKAVHEIGFEFPDQVSFYQGVTVVLEFLESIDRVNFSEKSAEEFEPTKIYAVAVSIVTPPTDQEIRIARKELEQSDMEVAIIATAISGFLLYLLISFIIKDWGHLPYKSISAVNPFLWWLASVVTVPVLMVLLIFFIGGIQTMINSEPEGLKEVCSLDYVGEIEAIKKQNKIVKKYVQNVGIMERKLLNEEVEFLKEFHFWQLEKCQVNQLKSREGSLYE